MSICVTPDFSFVVGSIGTQVLIPVQLPDSTGTLQPISQPTSATVTWLSPDGIARVLSCVNVTSSVFAWVVSAREFTTPRTQVGRCRVSTTSGSVFYTSMFTVQVTAQF